MKIYKKLLSILPIFSVLALLGCPATVAPVSSNSTIATSGEGTEAIPSSFAQFPDIPFPEKTVMNLDSTILLGSGENWAGKLVFSAPYSSSSMFDFYMAEMPKFGWNQVAVIRSKTSQMTYERKDRIAIISIKGDMNSSAKISLTAMPKSQNKKVRR
jgi:hypothetical protein